MKLYLSGHCERYDSEHILISIFPDEKPELVETRPSGDGDFAIIAIRRRREHEIAAVTIRYRGKTAKSECRCVIDYGNDPLEPQRRRRDRKSVV